MAHPSGHLRNLAAPDSMEITQKEQPKSTLFSSPKPHPSNPDPTVPSSTIQTISNHFSRLYANQKVLASLKGSSGHSPPPVKTHFHAKPLAFSSVSDTSCTALTKSKSQHGRCAAQVEKEGQKPKVREKDRKSVKESYKEHYSERALAGTKTDEVKKSSKKESKNKEFYGDLDVNKASGLLSKSQDFDTLKRSYQGPEMKRLSVSLSMGNCGGVSGGDGRRRSFCSSQSDLADFFSCNGVKVVSVDMPFSMQIHAVNCARKTHDSLEKFTSRTLAFTLKKEFDGVYGPAWHCIVGTSFGSFVTHSVGGFIYFSLDNKLYVLLFKTTVQRAD